MKNEALQKTELILSGSKIEFKKLTEEDDSHIAEFVRIVDLNKFENLQNFGKSPQEKLSNLKTVSDIDDVKIRDIDENLTKLLKDMDECRKAMDNKNPLVKWWYNRKIERLTSRQFIDEVKKRLVSDQNFIVETIRINKQNSEYLLNVHKELAMYIKASDEIKETCKDHPNLYLLDLRRNELQSTSTVIVQILTQLKVIETLYNGVSSKVNSVLNNVIPLWSAQFSVGYQLGKLAGLANSVNNVIDVSNNLIASNADKLYSTASATVDTVFKETVDIEKVKYAGDVIAKTITEVREKTIEHIENVRDNVEELKQIEEELVRKLNDSDSKSSSRGAVKIENKGGLSF